MLNIFIVFLSIVTIAFSYTLFKYASGTMALNQLNVVSITYFLIVIIFFIPSMLVVLGYRQGYGLEILSINPYLSVTVYYVLLFTLLIMSLTLYLIPKILKINVRTLYLDYLNTSIKPVFSPKDSYSFILLWLLIIISIIASIYVLRNYATIPIMHLFTSNNQELAVLRIRAGAEYSGSGFIKGIFAIGLPALLSYIFYVYYRMFKTTKWLVSFLIIFLITIFMKSYNLEKAPIIYFLFGFLLIEILTSNIVKKKFFKMIFFLGIVSIVVFCQVMKLSISDAIVTFIHRTMTGQLGGLYWHIYIFPDICNFLGFHSLPEFLTNLMGIDQLLSARVVMEIYNPIGIALGTAGQMCTLFVGEAYAVFGWVGAFFGVIAIGVIIETVFLVFLYLPKNPLNIGLFTYLSVLIPTSLIGGFLPVIFNLEMFSFIVVYVLFYTFGKIMKKLSLTG